MSDLINENTNPKSPFPAFIFNRLEFSGSLGDLGTLLPIAIGMIVLNGLNVTNVMVTVGLFYVIAGIYFKVPVPVQPMKVIGAYAIAVGLTPAQIISASLWMGICVLFMGTTGLIHIIGKYTPKSTIRGVQLGVGIILMTKGLGFMIQPDPNLAVQFLGPVSTGIILGIIGTAITLLFLENRKIPAAVIVISAGILLGLLIGKPVEFSKLKIGFYVPMPFPYGMPAWTDLMWVIPALVLPQLPMTIGNAILSNTDLMHEYFGQRAHRATYRSIANSQGIADVISFIWGGIPMCHGAGGLAANYRFGARTAGANIMIGSIFVLLGILLGNNAIVILNLLPMSILGVLLVFAGAQLALMIRDLSEKKDLFVALVMLGITLTVNLVAAFIAGIFIAHVVKSEKINV
ncbi:MAG: putative sulfate/molybdate transporter [Thermodesulfobacteriota bacterium]|nr:putative sulfate/molybdate transporter [Thermodesulfobacteriota bacterium]